MALIAPSSESSPSTSGVVERARVSWPDVASTPSAIGRSNDDPALRTSAGARLTVIAMRGKLEAGVANREADPVAALANGRVREADHSEWTAIRRRRRPRSEPETASTPKTGRD
jgi:hypothetical protein